MGVMRIEEVGIGGFGGTAVVVGEKVVVCLGFDVFECHEEDPTTKGIFEKGDGPTSKDTTGSDFVEFMPGIGPHVFVFAFDGIATIEADLKSIKWSGNKTLNTTCKSTGEEGGGWRGRRKDSFGRGGRRRMENSQDLEIRGIEESANGYICEEWRENMLREKLPSLTLDCSGKETWSGIPPRPPLILWTDSFCVGLYQGQ